MIKKYPEKIDKLMNPYPKESFNAETHDPAKDIADETWKRSRVLPLRELPTSGLKPKEIREGQMIGMYESKQDLYLIFAHKCNELQNKIDGLEARILELENK